jgi:integrase
MARNSKNFIPAYRLHKPSNHGIVEFEGNRIYLGDYDDPATQEKYHRLIAEWLANGRQLPVDAEEITVVELCNRYWKWCVATYPAKNGRLSSTAHRTKSVIGEILPLYGRINANEFTPKTLKIVQANWIQNGLVRRTVNEYTAIAVRIFRWGASEGLVPASVYDGVKTVEGIRKGRTMAKESVPVRPVPESHVEAVKPYVSRQIWALIQLQLLTAARGGELLGLRPVDINTSDSVWEATIDEHKTADLGHVRTLYFGSSAQAILKEFMGDRSLDAFLFNPQEANRERHRGCPSPRRANQMPTQRTSNRKIGDRYTSDSYRKAIARACRKADIPNWTPHQLRHNAATLIRREFGLDAAQVILGHATANVTQIYADLDKERARKVIGEIG